MSARPLESITGRALALALLDAQSLHGGRPMSLDDALLSINAAWRCTLCGSMWLRGTACRLCMRCRCTDRVSAYGEPCPVCDYQLD